MEYNKEEKIVEEQKHDRQESKEKLWKKIAIILSIGLLIGLVVWAANATTFRLLPFLGLLAFIIFIFVSLFWGIGWYRKIQELQGKLAGVGKLPPPVTLEQAAEIMEEMLKHPRYADYILGWEDHKIYNAGKDGKSLILAVRLKTTYNTNPFQYFIMNMHYPRDRWSYINQKVFNPSEITRCVNALAFNPEKDPDEREIVVDNPLTGTRMTTREKIQHKEKEDEEKEKGDLQ